MNIYINWQNKLMSYTLQDVQNTKVVEIPLREIGIDTVIVLEYWENNWNIVTKGLVQVCKPQKQENKVQYIHINTAPVVIDSVVYCSIADRKGILQLYTVDSNTDLQLLTKYRIDSLTKTTVITVGSADSNTICYPHKLIQKEHFSITITANGVSVKTQGNLWVNNIKITGTQEIAYFDMITLYNLRICVLPQMIVVNNVGTVRLQRINEIDLLGGIERQAVSDIKYTNKNYLRKPRQLQVIDTEKIAIENVPNRKQKDDTPWLLTIGPTLTMMLPMLAMTMINVNVNVRGGNGQGGASIASYLGVMASMGLSAVIGAVWGIVRKKRQVKQEKLAEERRYTKYTEYIENLKEELYQCENSNRKILGELYPETQEYIRDVVEQPSPYMWSMNINQGDYGLLRIGTGTTINPKDIEHQKEKFSLEDVDELKQLPQQIKDEHKYVHNMPIVYNILDTHVIGVVGAKDFIDNILRNLVIQLTHMYSYTDVLIGVSADYINAEMQWIKYLPHTYTTDGMQRLFGYDTSSNDALISYLVQIIKMRKETKKENLNKKQHVLPYIVVFCYSSDLMKSDAIRQYINDVENLGIIFVLLFGSMALLPNGCNTIIENDNIYKGIYTLNAVPDKNCTVDFEQVSLEDAQQYAQLMAYYNVQEAVDGRLPTMVELFDILRIDMMEQWDLLRAYQTHDTSKSIRGLLGVGHGKTMWLDIHEKQQGPHGLVAGMTGSGKSEMLQTLILTWALSYSPTELAFVLIDYKGGGMANIFAKLPHTAGIITNIADDMAEDTENTDGTQDKAGNVQTLRALNSIKAEVKHRQSIFKQYKINHIDAYTQMYKQKQVKEPLPHLVIIVDEFAELRKEQHTFISDLVSAARVGRSLGVHLILATQKPAGVVDDEIWSNSRFRCCLRVQDKQDSMGMLHRPEAAYLTQIGRMYYQVGTDEVFEEIQCAYTGAEYIPVTNRQHDEEVVFELVHLNGEVVPVKRKKNRTGKTQLDTSIEYICNECTKLQIPSARKLWLPVLPRLMSLSTIDSVKTKTLAVTFGAIDDVVHQQRISYTIELLHTANIAIIGNTGCGKTTMLQTLLYNIVHQYTPEEVQFYICDYSSGILRAFENVNHCGGVLNDPYKSAELMQRLLDLLEKEIDDRRKLFDAVSVSNIGAYKQVQEIPLKLLIIDNWALWLQVHENLQARLLQLLRDGVKYGIQVILTASNGNELKYNYRAYIQQYIAIQLGDKSTYREFLGITPETLPATIAGRGLVCVNGGIAEYQTAVAVQTTTEAERNMQIQKDLGALKYTTNTRAAKIPVLPKDKTYSMLAQEFEQDYSAQQKFFIGFIADNIKPVTVDLIKDFVYIVSDFTTNSAGIKSVFRNLITIGVQRKYKQILIDATNTINDKFAVSSVHTDIEAYEFLKMLDKLYGKRAEERKKFLAAGHTVEEYVKRKEKYVIYITNFVEFVALYQTATLAKYMVDTDGTKEDCVSLLTQYIQRGAEYGVNFIVGCNREAQRQIQYQTTVYKVLMDTRNFVHIGGEINELVSYKSAMPLQQQMQVTDTTVGYTKIDNRDTMLWLPQ